MSRQIIRRKSDKTNVGVIQAKYPESINNPFEWEIENNVIPNSGGNINDYEVIDEQSWLDIAKQTPEYKKRIIQEELIQLDSALLDARLIEDLIEGNPIKKEKRDIITRKKELRNQLQALGV